jgi:hydroxylaminobenzene mutase
MATNKKSAQLIFWGMVLFFLGLITGLLLPAMTNQRMGLSAHLEGILNGLFLMLLGLIWPKIKCPPRMLNLIYILVLYAGFANFAAVLLAGFTGAGKMMPIAGGDEGSPALELVISFLLVSLTISILAAAVLLLYGLYKTAFDHKPS